MLKKPCINLFIVLLLYREVIIVSEMSIRPLRASKEAFKDLKILATKHEVNMGEMLEKLIENYKKGEK